MDNDEFTPPSKQPLPDPPYSRRKDPYREPPVKDFSHLLSGKSAPGSRKHRRPLLLVLALLVIIGIAGSVYWFGIRAKPVKHITVDVVRTSTNATQGALTMTSYSSSGFGVTLNHPTTWTVNDGGATSLTITSPVTQLTNAAGKTVNGKIIVQFQPQGQVPSAFGGTSALAVLNSQLLTFTSPTSDQAAQTYLSFVQYTSATVVGTLNGIYVTGNYGYQKDGTIPESDLTGLDPLITVTFGQCTTTACSSVQPLSLSSNEWNNTDFSTPITDILKSLVFS